MSNDKIDIEKLDESGKELIPMDSEALKNLYMVGIKNVDMSTVKPSEIFLMQSNSHFNDFMDDQKNTPKVGQFFISGTRSIVDSFECNITNISDSTYINPRKPELGNLTMKIIIGAMAGKETLFGMKFKGTALDQLNPLLTRIVEQKKPAFSFKILMESKLITGKENSWYVPVLRIEDELDGLRLAKLAEVASKFDQRSVTLDEDPEDFNNDGEKRPF